MRSISVKVGKPLSEAIKIIEDQPYRMAVVVDFNERVVGTITDGDVRRFFLDHRNLDGSIGDVMNSNPILLNESFGDRENKRVLKENNIEAAPVVSENGIFVDVCAQSDLNDTSLKIEKIDNIQAAVIMAGGEGKRLRPLTETMPKPLLKIGKKTILEHSIEHLASIGVKKIFLAVNYLADLIEKEIGDGHDYGLSVEYLREPKKLGTAGALSLINEELLGPIIVMNGDVMTDLDFRNFEEFHLVENAKITVAVSEYNLEVPFGVLDIDNGVISGLREKPTEVYFCNAGIYLMEPELLRLIPKDTFFDMTDLIQLCLDNDYKLVPFPIHEYWSDLGTPKELEDARKLMAERSNG
ncbi:nucleotidyltransferase family protein [Gammaproteobacteria bacterium]|nr:nucleotidyltransferase family protein [Gammaproteobacteria bacterium]